MCQKETLGMVGEGINICCLKFEGRLSPEIRPADLLAIYDIVVMEFTRDLCGD